MFSFKYIISVSSHIQYISDNRQFLFVSYKNKIFNYIFKMAAHVITVVKTLNYNIFLTPLPTLMKFAQKC